jgi:hypothetical protein
VTQSRMLSRPIAYELASGESSGTAMIRTPKTEESFPGQPTKRQYGSLLA